MSSSDESDDSSSRLTYDIGKTDADAWEDELMPYLKKRYRADEERMKLDIITRIRGVRKSEIRVWEEKCHEDMVPQRSAAGDISKESWTNSTPVQIIRGICLHFRSKVQEENAEEKFYREFKKKRKEVVADLCPRFDKEVQKVKSMDRDSMTVRTFFCKLFKDSSEPYSMTMELTKLLDSRGDTLSRLYRRAEEFMRDHQAQGDAGGQRQQRGRQASQEEELGSSQGQRGHPRPSAS